MQQKECLIRIVVVAVLLYALFHFSAAYVTLQQTLQLQQDLQARYEQLLRENADLRERLAKGAEAESVEAMARERLGLVMPGETIYYFTEHRED